MTPFASAGRSGSGAGTGPGTGPRRRRSPRDRHGRGLRGPLVPAGLPLHRSRAERFDDYVLDAVERLEHRWPEELRLIEFAVEDVPPPGRPGSRDAWAPAYDDGGEWTDDPIPLARMFPAGRARRTRIVVYRRPIEVRTAAADLAELVHDIVVEEVAHVLGRDPEDIDPGYPAD